MGPAPILLLASRVKINKKSRIYGTSDQSVSYDLSDLSNLSESVRPICEAVLGLPRPHRSASHGLTRPHRLASHGLTDQPHKVM